MRKLEGTTPLASPDHWQAQLISEAARFYSQLTKWDDRFDGTAPHRVDHLIYRPIARTPENITRLTAALGPYSPYLRGAPPGLPFRWDAETIRRGLNFTLTTTLGDIDLLGEIVGGGGYTDLLPHSQVVTVSGLDYHCLSLARLIHVKRAAGRPKDLEAIAELEALLEERHDREQA